MKLFIGTKSGEPLGSLMTTKIFLQSKCICNEATCNYHIGTLFQLMKIISSSMARSHRMATNLLGDSSEQQLRVVVWAGTDE